MRPPRRLSKADLDSQVLNVELLLISVVQGLALSALASSAGPVLSDFKFEYWLYALSAFLLLLNYWSQAIIHSISFVTWPLDLGHSFLYFLTSLLEVMAFGQITNPSKWFVFIFLFFVVGLLLYVVDLRWMAHKRDEFSDSPQRKALYEHVVKRQRFELFFFLPPTIAFHAVVLVLLYGAPQFFLEGPGHLYAVALQAVFGIGYLVITLMNLSTRSDLIEACVTDE
jgi:hypothetical protein